MTKSQSISKKVSGPTSHGNGERKGSGTPCRCGNMKADPPRKKGWWTRYMERLKKHEGDVRSCCR